MVYLEPVGVVIVVDPATNSTEVVVPLLGLVSDLVPVPTVAVLIGLRVSVISLELSDSTLVIVVVESVTFRA